MTKKLFLCALILCGAVYAIFSSKSLSFSPRRITANIPYCAAWETKTAQPAIAQLVRGKYTYLASGTQSYAFVSEDGTHVIKFFRMKHLIPSLSDYFKPDRVRRREENLRAIFSAYVLAYDALQEETGLLAVHLNPTTHLHKTITIQDRLGRQHTIDLDRTPFIVQKKAELIFTYFQRLWDTGQQERIEEGKQAVLDLVHRRITKGFGDRDKAVSHNYGFVEGKPIHLDIGRLFLGQRPGEEAKIRDRLNSWSPKQG